MSKQVLKETFVEGGIEYEIVAELEGETYRIAIYRDGKKVVGTECGAELMTVHNFGGLQALVDVHKLLVRPRK